MGKSFYYNKSYLIIIFLFILMTPPILIYAEPNEFEIFDRAYEYYLSYQPEKAIEEFTFFLKEFPESSARDAVLFWLGKSFAQIQLTEDAKKVFNEIESKYPQSPFISFIRKEIENLESKGNNKTKLNFVEKEDLLKKIVQERDENKKNLEEKEKELIDLQKENSKLKEAEISFNELLKEERRKTEELASLLTKCEEEKESVTPLKDTMKENIQKIEKMKILLEDEKRKAESMLTKIKEYEYKESYIKQSLFVLQSLDIQDLVWRTGNPYEDMENENLLYEKAKELNININIEKYKDLMNKFTMDQIQSDYIKKIIILSGLIDFRLKEMPDERMVEVLKVKFSDNKFDRTSLAVKLQTDAIKGVSFYDISRSYEEKLQYSEMLYEELQDWIKKRIQSLQDGQIGFIWSDDGYMIVKKEMKKLSYNPFQKTSPEKKEKIRNYVKQWIEKYKDQAKY